MEIKKKNYEEFAQYVEDYIKSERCSRSEALEHSEIRTLARSKDVSLENYACNIRQEYLPTHLILSDNIKTKCKRFKDYDEMFQVTKELKELNEHIKFVVTDDVDVIFYDFGLNGLKCCLYDLFKFIGNQTTKENKIEINAHPILKNLQHEITVLMGEWSKTTGDDVSVNKIVVLQEELNQYYNYYTKSGEVLIPQFKVNDNEGVELQGEKTDRDKALELM